MTGIFSDFIKNEVTTEDKKTSLFDRQKEGFKKDNSIMSLSNALFGKEQNKNQLIDIPLDSIVVGKQVRTDFDSEEIQELAESIKEHGLLQPVTVHKLDGNKYYLICGEKRFRACKVLGAATIKSVVISQPKNQDEMLALQIIENMHRSTPPVFDIAVALSKLKESHSVDEICKTLSCKKSYVYNNVNIVKYTDENERELFKSLNLAFLLKYVDFKSKVKAEARKVCEAIQIAFNNLPEEKNNKEDRQQIANKILKKAINLYIQEEKEKKLKEKLKSAGQNYENLQIGKNITFSWKKIDKIQPQTSAMLEAYITKHPLSKPVEVIAEALAEYLSKESSENETRRSGDHSSSGDLASLGDEEE